jgi:enoyl-CoA hydratase/carnithine racemase
MPSDTVLARRHGAVLLLTLNRPDRLNAWNTELELRYFELLAEADDDPDVRAIVVTGAGRGFCAGADLDDVASAADGRVPAQSGKRREFPLSIRKPLVAAVNGAAAGLGLVEALYCDIRFATPEAKLTTAFARRGLIAEYGISWLLRRLVGHGRARDLLLSARVVTGAEAHRIGLVEHLAEPGELVDAALAYAADLAENCSPTSLAIIKGQLSRDAETGLGAAIVEAETLMRESFERADVVEGVTSYRERRAPAFPPLPARS